MRISVTLTFWILLSSALAAWAQGNGVGNGGDVVYCHQSQENSFSGYYSLDYILTLQNGSDKDLRKVASLAESQERLTRLLGEKCYNYGDQDYGEHLQSFYDLTDNHTDWLQNYIWLDSAYGLVDIKDERETRMIPENCKTDGNPNIIQAIIRKKDAKGVIFEYDPSVLADLGKNPLQLSFLLLHEYLWNFTWDVEKIRLANHWLHSQQVEEMTYLQFGQIIGRFLAPNGPRCVER